jgi:uncharacterized protein (DUF1697 family)
MPDENRQSGVTPAPAHSPGEQAAWIALLRGITVRGTRNLPMAALAQVLAASGLTSVKTYIQTGNIVFRHPEPDASGLTALVTRAIRDHFGVEPAIFVFRHSVLRWAIHGMPFADLDLQNSVATLHIFFLDGVPQSTDLSRLKRLLAPDDRFHLGEGIAYLHAPSGFGRPRIDGALERVLGVNATARNWRTITALDALASVDE